ncbi:MAG: terpene cyclase/mutase family protein [Pirellulaceae bacterium]|nr:terpene cyclase/mutase family protein [Pirellulaceae bacterium]
MTNRNVWRVIVVATWGLWMAGCGGSKPEPVIETPEPVVETTPEPPPPPPEPDPIQLAELPGVTLQPGGHAAVEVAVQRNGNEGPIQVQADAMPEGVTAKAEPIGPNDSSTQLVLAADMTLGDVDLVATVSVTVKLGEQTASQPLAVHVPRLQLPTFLPVSEVLLQPGKNQTVNVAVQRDGFEGPLELRVDGAPDNVTCTMADIHAGQDATKLDIAAVPGVKDGTYPLKIATTLYGREIVVEVPLKIESRPFVVNTFRVVTLSPGQTQRVEVPVERRGYNGAVQLKADSLPPGVTVREVSVAPDGTTATLEITASPAAEQRVSSSKIVSTAGHLTATGPIVIRVAGGDESYFPPGVTANKEISSLLKRGSIGGRLTTESKQALLDFYGGTAESEAAVMRGLKWLAAHQQADGSWSLKEYSKDIAGCDCMTEFEKQLDDSPTAGTAFGILPFLGAGVTHNRAPKEPAELASYMPVVEKGLIYLAQNQVRSKDNKDGFLGGSMYAHALATIAFCEAYGLSGDERLKVNAQLAIKYLLNAQHQAGGGWRYSAGQAGDMSVTGWVFLAIRSAQLTGIDVLKPPLERAARFVDSCGVGPDGAKMSRYAYTPGTPEKLTLTAAGLLTRQYLGWRNDQPDLIAGCQHLMANLPPESGTSLGSIYYYYYATQVLHHMEGPDFDLWNHRMREHLIRSQERSGHKDGSWNPQGTDYGSRAGRMYATSMALLTLQVYYRHLPMYRTVRRT